MSSIPILQVGVTVIALTAAAGALEPTTSLVSINSSGSASGNGQSYGQALSPNGRFVVFETGASDIVPNDTNGTTDVFVRDLRKSTTTLVSVNSTGSAGGSSYGRTLSPNGRFVVFESEASDLVANDTNGTGDIFVRDLRTGTTTLVSVNSTGTGSGNGQSYEFTLSGHTLSNDGRFVLFNSSATDLVANDTNGSDDIFVRDLKSGTTTLVSVNSNGNASGNGNSFFHTLSANGHLVLFESDASDLVPNDTNGAGDVFVRDVERGSTTLVSVNSSGTGSGNRFSFDRAMSPNGRFVLFNSVSSDLGPNGTKAPGGDGDAFVRDVSARITTLVSIDADGTSGSGGFGTAISRDGRVVLLFSPANDLVANDTNGTTGDVFVRDLKSGTTTLVSLNRTGSASGNGESHPDALSANGRFVLFSSYATDLVATPKGASGTCGGGPCYDVFVRQLR